MPVVMKSEYFVRTLTAGLPGVQAAVAAKAEKIGSTARRNLAAVRYEGESSIEVEHNIATDDFGKYDSFVSLVDPDNALSIEFGHIHNFSGEYIPGKYVLTRAMIAEYV